MASGLRRQLPMPRHGASTNTRSKLPCGVVLDPGVALARQRAALDIADAGAAQPLAGAFQPPARMTSQATSLPRFFISAASARVLPPAPAQKSTTRMPGRASASSAASCEPSSCTSTSPSLKRGGAGERRAVLEPQAERRPRGRLGLDALGGERAARGVAVGLQQVDPQIDRRRRVERRHLVSEPPADRRAARWRFEPFRQVVGDGARHLRVGQAAAGEAAHQPLLRPATAAPGGSGRRRSWRRCRRRSSLVDQHQRGDHAAARRRRDLALRRPARSTSRSPARWRSTA